VLIDILLTSLSMFTEMSASVYECARFTGPQNRPRNLAAWFPTQVANDIRTL
jgi:hypothetical protein